VSKVQPPVTAMISGRMLARRSSTVPLIQKLWLRMCVRRAEDQILVAKVRRLFLSMFFD